MRQFVYTEFTCFRRVFTPIYNKMHMATFKVCVRKQRNDGFYPVYIRVTHNRSVGYIKTGKLVNDAGLRQGEVIDPYVMKFCSNRIVAYVERLNKVWARPLDAERRAGVHSAGRRGHLLL